jgi:hypothetical protein
MTPMEAFTRPEYLQTFRGDACRMRKGAAAAGLSSGLAPVRADTWLKRGLRGHPQLLSHLAVQQEMRDSP